MHRRNLAAARRQALGVDQADTRFYPLKTVFDAVDPVGHAGILLFQESDPRLDLTHVVTRFIHGQTDMPQMFEDGVVAFRAHKGYSFPETY